MTPYVGQIVLYTSNPGNALGDIPIPAMVTAVWSDTCVNLELMVGMGKGCCFESVSFHDLLDDANTWQFNLMDRMIDLDAAIEQETEQGHDR